MTISTVLNQPEVPEPVPPQTVQWSSVLQFGLSALAILILWSLAFSALLFGLSARLGSLGGAALGAVDELQLFLVAAGMAFCGLLLVPSAWYSLRRLMGRPVQGSPAILRRFRPTLLIFLFPLLVGAGYWVSQNSTLSWLLLPPIHVLAVSLPILWLAYLAVRDLPVGSPQRAWGSFASGLALSPLLIMAAELAAILAGLGALVVFFMTRPELVETVNDLAERLSTSAASPEIVLRILQPVVSNPQVIFTVLVFGAVIVPLIEEALKPLGVWLLAGRRLMPAEGFVLGALSGTGYALIESLFLASNSQDWAFVIFARIGTSAMHILTAGMVGWGLASAWQSGRYVRLGATYLLAVLLHGLWNGLTLSNLFAGMIETPASGAGFFIQIGEIAPYLLGGLAGAALLAILWVNRLLRRSVNDGKNV
jgi:RsiW-degrading membrane proteinase PrsW (M82 family)